MSFQVLVNNTGPSTSGYIIGWGDPFTPEFFSQDDINSMLPDYQVYLIQDDNLFQTLLDNIYVKIGTDNQSFEIVGPPE